MSLHCLKELRYGQGTERERELINTHKHVPHLGVAACHIHYYRGVTWIGVVPRFKGHLVIRVQLLGTVYTHCVCQQTILCSYHGDPAANQSGCQRIWTLVSIEWVLEDSTPPPSTNLPNRQELIAIPSCKGKRGNYHKIHDGNSLQKKKSLFVSGIQILCNMPNSRPPKKEHLSTKDRTFCPY